jgi:integrase
MLKEAARKKIIPTNPLDGIPLSEPAPTHQPCYTAEQVAQLIDAADEYMRPIIMCFALTGMRLGEVRDLRWEDVVFGTGDEGQIVIRHGGSGEETKTKKIRRIPIHPALRPVLQALPRKAPTVFTRAPSAQDPQGVKPINQRKVLERVKAMCKKLNFPGYERMKVHTFRHFFCSMLAKEGAPERYIRGLLGHSSTGMDRWAQ